MEKNQSILHELNKQKNYCRLKKCSKLFHKKVDRIVDIKRSLL